MYDYCLIDTAPHLDLLATNALTASDSIIIPMQNEEYALNVMNILKPFIDTATENYNPQLKIAGILVMHWLCQTDLAQNVLIQINNLAQELGTKVYQTQINSMIRQKEMAVNDYNHFVNEFVKTEGN